MYERRKKGWTKHIDFILLDVLCLQLSCFLAHQIRFGLGNPFLDNGYLDLALVYLLIDLCVAVMFDSFGHVLQRGYYKEALSVIRHVFLVEGATLLYLFSTKRSAEYSRISFWITGLFYIVLTYVVRIIRKAYLSRSSYLKTKKSILVVSTARKLPECLDNILSLNTNKYHLIRGVVVDVPMKGQTIHEVPVVANREELLNFVSREWVDEVYVCPDETMDFPVHLLDSLHQMGIVTHVVIEHAGEVRKNKYQVERIGKDIVMTTSINYVNSTQLLLKRLMDILGGLVGCLVTLLLILILGPMIYISSPGPIFFAQERIGRNGKKFKIYKFRTMYPDAEERKKELMAQNRVEDGMMFKLDFDPRIIGNKILPDGTTKEGIGSFIRKTSLDEFPQFFNILKGDMSLVGTRPPTLDEWEKYEPHHRARMSFRPGLTGMWQVSGRSNITDFEEVVRLDTQYIDEWSIGLDVKLLFKTVGVVFGSEGAM